MNHSNSQKTANNYQAVTRDALGRVITLDQTSIGRDNIIHAYSNNQLQQLLRYLYNGYLQIAALDAKNISIPVLLHTLYWDLTEPAATRPLIMIRPEDGDQNWYEYTHTLNKNVSHLIDKTGSIVAHYDYDAYGNLTEQTGTLADVNPIRCSSEYHDDDLGLVYYNYRHYNPKDGRWINRDPISESGGINLYGFVQNDFMNYFDFLGLTKELPKDLIESIVKSGHKLHEKMKSEGFKNEYCTRICKTCSGEYKMTSMQQGGPNSCSSGLTGQCEKGETLIGFVHTHRPGVSTSSLSQDDLDYAEIGRLIGEDKNFQYPPKLLTAVTWSTKSNPGDIKTQIYQFSESAAPGGSRGTRYTHNGKYSKDGKYEINGKKFTLNINKNDKTPRQDNFYTRKRMLTGV